MRNASQLNSQFDSEFSEFDLPPILKKRSGRTGQDRQSAGGGYAKRSAEGGCAKRSIELPLIEPSTEPSSEPPSNSTQEKASVKRSAEGGYAKRSGGVKPSGKPKQEKVGKKQAKVKPQPKAKHGSQSLKPEPPPYPPNSGGNCFLMLFLIDAFINAFLLTLSE